MIRIFASFLTYQGGSIPECPPFQKRRKPGIFLSFRFSLALEASLEAFLFPDNPEAMDYREKVVMDDRENVALERIVQDFPQGNNSVILIYGASHDFRDNIAEWNRTHPNMKYSLRIISPKGNGIGSYTQSK